RNTAGKVQTRHSPVGPVIVPASVKPCGSAMVGQPEAGVTTAGPVGVGDGVGAGGLLMVILPPLPGEAISSGPQAESASTLQPRMSERVRLVTADGPLMKPRIDLRQR